MNIVLKHLLHTETDVNAYSLSSLQELAHTSLFTSILIGLLCLALIIAVLKILVLRLKIKTKYITLELKSLNSDSGSPIATQQFFSVVHSLAGQMPFTQKMIGVSKNYSCEIHSSKQKGIRYIISIPESDESLFRSHLVSYLPGMSVSSVQAMQHSFKHSTITNFVLSNHYAYPLRTYSELDDHDPISFVTGSLAKPAEHEQLIFQIVISPTKNNLHPANLLGIADSNKILFQQIQHKASQPLFITAIRLLVYGDQSFQSRKYSVTSSLASLANGTYQSLTPSRNFTIPQFAHFLFSHCLLNPVHNAVLSVSEIATLYHFPSSVQSTTENLQKQHAKQLPAPTALKQSETFDNTFAKNIYGGFETPIGISLEERRRHMYILGATGTGKSTLLLSMIEQDLKHNKGLAVIDPHGDLIDSILELVPEDRISDVVYFNPDDLSYPIGINVLELTPGLKGDDALREKEFIAESIISLFNKLYSDKFSGPRMEYILRNAIHTAFEVEHATLFTVYKLLINTRYRNSIIRKLKDENLIEFWKLEFAKAGDYQKVKMISPITNKIGRFLFSPTAKRILEQPTSTINFDEILDNGKILLCNLSKGKIGEDNSEVFGIVMLAKIQLEALKRARIAAKARRDFYVYVDEFQNFATQSFAQILSESRKYRLNAILAHQTTSQIENLALVHTTLANAGTVICFRTANPEDEKLILPQFAPYVDLGEIRSLPSFNFYMRLSALKPEEPFSGETIPLKIVPNIKKVHKIIASSRKLYAKKYTEPVQESQEQTKVLIKRTISPSKRVMVMK